MNTFVSNNNNNITAFNTLLIYVCATREKIFRIFIPACESSCKNCLEGDLVIKTEGPKKKTNDFFPITYFVMVLVKSCAL